MSPKARAPKNKASGPSAPLPPPSRAARQTKAAPPSSAPHPMAPTSDDLLQKRDTFIQTFFKKGAELTEEILREDDRLRARLAEVEAENAALRAQVASDDAIRDLLSKIEFLERDKHELLSRFRDAQASSSQYSSRFAEIEAENSRLASLYIASYQLHSTLDLPTVVRQLKELLAQFVGARSFAIYLADGEKGELVPIASEGVVPGSLPRVRGGEGPIGRAFQTGNAAWTEGDATSGTLAAPAACIPLRILERSAGVIVVISTFEQKPAFIDVDFELFRLLGAHAASAIAASRLFAKHGARIPSLEAFADVE